MFSGLSWAFPIGEVSQYVQANMMLIMPLFVIILSVLVAMLVLDGLTDMMLKIAGFVVGRPYQSQHSIAEKDDDESD